MKTVENRHLLRANEKQRKQRLIHRCTETYTDIHRTLREWEKMQRDIEKPDNSPTETLVKLQANETEKRGMNRRAELHGFCRLRDGQAVSHTCYSLVCLLVFFLFINKKLEEMHLKKRHGCLLDQ